MSRSRSRSYERDERREKRAKGMQKPFFRREDLQSMSVQEKKQMTCLEWNRGSCSQNDKGKQCHIRGLKKKHVCSKVYKDKKYGLKVCWGYHREREHMADKKKKKMQDLKIKTKISRGRDRDGPRDPFREGSRDDRVRY